MSVFVDDILVISKSFDEHLKHLDIVFSKLRQANLVLNYEKCEFGKSDIKFKENLHVFTTRSKGYMYVLNCDASDYAIGEILYQRNDNGELK